MPKIQEIRSVSPKSVLSGCYNKINGLEYPNLPQKEFELLLFCHVIVTDEYTIKKCSRKSNEGDSFYRLMLPFITKIKEIEHQQSGRLYKLVTTSLDDVLGHKLLECLTIIYLASNRDYSLKNIKPLKTTPLIKLERYLRNNPTNTGAEARLVKDANKRIRNFHREINIMKCINTNEYCQRFKSLNELVNDLVIKDLEFTNSKYSENIELPKNHKLLYDSKPGRYVMNYLESKAKLLDYAIQDIRILKYNHLIKMLKPR